MEKELNQVLQKELQDPLLRCSVVEQGGNSQAVLVSSPRHGELLVKRYIADGRKRLETEYAALKFLSQNGLPVARPLLARPAENYAVYSRLPGTLPDPEKVDQHLVQLLDFLRRLHGFRKELRDFPPAAEACLCAGETLALVKKRRQQLNAVADDALQNFLTRKFDPCCQRLCEVFQTAAASTLDVELSDGQQTLSPSDFGLHNALCCPEGQLAFVDFEYFGRDDPAKLVSDFLWHPAMQLSARFKTDFLQGCRRIYGEEFYQRFQQAHPLHGLKWVLLLLNEFLPHHWQRRRFAGEKMSRQQRQQNQLEKAQSLLARIELLEKGTTDAN